MKFTDDPLLAVRKLFPDSPDEELEEVKEFLDVYASVTWQIYKRLEREKPKILDELMERNQKTKE